MRYNNFNLARRSEKKSIWFVTTSVGFSHLRPRGQTCFESHLNLLKQLFDDDQTSLLFLPSVVKNDMIRSAKNCIFNESFGTRMEPNSINAIFNCTVFQSNIKLYKKCEQTSH